MFQNLNIVDTAENNCKAKTFFHSIPPGCKICVNLLYQALKCLPITFQSLRDEERVFYIKILISNRKIFQRTSIAYIFSLPELLYIC